MKNYFYTLVKTAIIIVFFIPGSINANPGNSSSIQNQTSGLYSLQKQDSLPEGVTEDWLNSLRDENGNKISITKRNKVNDPGDEGDALQRKVFNGLNPGDQFGYSLKNAGDVNGDGYDDIIVGAIGYSSFTGRAYIFFGGIIMNTVADVILTGEAANNYFGVSVSSAGDVNGDGYSDVIVGAYGYSSYTGRAYIYLGGAAMNNTADVIITGASVSNYMGFTVSSAGDVNGDGYADVIAGSHGYSTSTGRAFIYFGGAAMNNVADVTLTGESSNNLFGYSVSSAGDVNGDGYDDVISGAYGYSSYTGRAYIYFGGAAMNSIADITITGEAASNYFGISVSSAGDVNGDGYADVICGASVYSSSTGRAYIYFGGSAMNNVADVVFTGEASNNNFGISVSSAGDINGDGYTDVIVGAEGFSSSTGRVYIYFGGTVMNNVADVTITGEATGNYFGASVTTAGDVNGDGYADVIIGADGFTSNTGRAYLYDYFMKNEITNDISFTGAATNNNFGYSVSTAGDVNGDGYSDIVVGAPSYSSSTGRAYIYFGGQSMDNIADVTMTGETTNSAFGVSVSTAGDLNGDGYADVIVGAYGYSGGTGRAYIYFGGPSMDNVADVTMTGEAVNNNFGVSVSTAGDVNGDGYSDIIVGAYAYTSFTGRAYIYFGGSAMDNVADVTMTGEAINNNFGVSVSTAGDVNGDGYADVIVGAYGHSSSTGRAYIYYGGAAMNNLANVTLTGETINSYFGESVSNAGDVNGDGYGDVIVGANGYSSSTGRTYIYYGGTVMNNVADVTMTGETINFLFGESVSNAGDVNGDGYADVIVGAYGYSSSTGRTYIYYGGAVMDNIVDVNMTGEATNNIFGKSVSTAGDVNGDGYADLIVGANGYSSSTGRAYIYNGSAISAKPILNYVKDVPNDQGGKVVLKWARSSYDVYGDNMITDYVVQRSYPPSGGSFSWKNITYISATNEPFYTYTASTPYDSSSNSNGTFFFRITARTSVASQYWRSGILSGRSIDNIAPLMVSPFTSAAISGNVSLNWKKSTSSDLMNYILYRSISPTIDPDTELVFATTTDSTYLDTSPLSGLYYYFIVAQDIHNNKSPVNSVASPNITLNLTMFIQGFYNASSDSQVSDTITVYLRNQTSPYSIVDNAKAVVSPGGNAVLIFGNAPSGNYYIVVTHRNSIETWSAAPVSLTNGTPVSYNFSNASSQAFGNNIKQVDSSPIRFAFYGGDVNQDGAVDLTDITSVYNNSISFLTGYVVTDVNGDNIVDLTDLTLTYNNASSFVIRVRP